MPRLFLFSILLAALPLAAQPWSPLRLGDTSNYRLNGAAYITHTLWIDSFQTAGADTVFLPALTGCGCGIRIRCTG
jgi:hypothetical protein